MNSSHHSRLSTLMIDCLDTHFDDALAFWSAALGISPARRPRAGQRYVTLGEIPGPVFVRLQRVEKDPGYHLDVETDDLRAERGRMEAAGAHAKYRVKRWWVLEDPSGNALCLVRPESEGFPRNANRWSAEK